MSVSVCGVKVKRVVVEGVEELGERCDGMGPDANDVVEVTKVKER